MANPTLPQSPFELVTQHAPFSSMGSMLSKTTWMIAAKESIGTGKLGKCAHKYTT